MYYVTMQITFPIPEFARKERNLHYDVVHVTTKWVSKLVLDHAIVAIKAYSMRCACTTRISLSTVTGGVDHNHDNPAESC